MTLLARLALVLALAFGAAAPAAAETAPKLPKGMTQAEFDRLVVAISREVLKQLRDQGAKPEAAPPAPGTDAPALARRFGEIAATYPLFAQRVGDLGRVLDARESGGRSALGLVVLLVLAAAAALAIERAVSAALARPRAAILARSVPPLGLGALAALLLVDAVPVAAVWVIAEAAQGWLAGSAAQIALASLLLGGLFTWRFNALIFRAWLQPDLPAARVAPLDDGQARLLYRCLNAIVLLALAIRAWIGLHLATGTPPDVLAAAALLNNPFVTAGFIAIVLIARRPVAAWLAALIGAAPGGDGWRAVLARNWWLAGVAFYLILGFGSAYGVLSGRIEVSRALSKTQNIVFGLLLAETLMWYLTRRKAAGAVATGAAGAREPRLVDVAVRCLRVAVRVGVALALAEIWLIHVLGVTSTAEWAGLGRSLATAGIVAFAGYVLWQIVRFQIDLYLVRNPIAAAGPGAADGDGEAHPQSASRLRTMMPLFRFAIAATLLVLTILIVLSELGVNTAPLIAGASIFGLALSFGSQSLVRDIVSGIFYLVDDAFRVGEYVDTGKAKGTVEGFTLRSLQLRHQNGQIHTIPFGQLGAITNFSRDWIIMKFNIRLALKTDIELVRKTTKKIGQEMMDDPDIKKDLIEPLKMQGIADIVDNSLVVRFKLTAKPGNPTFVQRQAIKRIYKAFQEKGIEFAQATVSVQTMGVSPEIAAAAGAGTAKAAATE